MVERLLAKQQVAGSTPVFRSKFGLLEESGRPRLTVYENITGSNPVQPAKFRRTDRQDGKAWTCKVHHAAVRFRLRAPSLEAECIEQD